MSITSAQLQPTHSPEVAQVNGCAARILQYVLLAMAVLYIGVYVMVACLRMRYPYELEWMEGAAVDHVRWILSGRPLYVEPSLEFTPFIYTPLYFYVAAAVSKVLGVGFLPLRLVSFLASLGCLWLIGRFVRRETGSWTWGIVSAGLFAATYRLSGAWLDIARVDSLFLLLALGSIYLLRFREGARWMVAAGLLMGLAFLTKQTALFIALPLALYPLLFGRGWGRIAFAAAFGGFLIGSTWLLDAWSGGWYRYYVFDLPGGHPFFRIMLFGFWWYDIGRNVAVALAMTIFALALQGVVGSRRDMGFYVLMAAGLMGASWFARLHTGGYDNVLLPACACLAIGFGIGAFSLHRAVCGALRTAARLQTPQAWHPENTGRRCGSRRRRGLPHKGGGSRGRCWRGSTRSASGSSWSWRTGRTCRCPEDRDERAGHALIQRLKELGGDALLPDHGFLHTMAGSNTFHAHTMAISDVLRGKDRKGAGKLEDEIRQALRAGKFDVVVVDAVPEGTTLLVQTQARKQGFGLPDVGPNCWSCSAGYPGRLSPAGTGVQEGRRVLAGHRDGDAAGPHLHPQSVGLGDVAGRVVVGEDGAVVPTRLAEPVGAELAHPHAVAEPAPAEKVNPSAALSMRHQVLRSRPGPIVRRNCEARMRTH